MYFGLMMSPRPCKFPCQGFNLQHQPSTPSPFSPVVVINRLSLVDIHSYCKRLMGNDDNLLDLYDYQICDHLSVKFNLVN